MISAFQVEIIHSGPAPRSICGISAGSRLQSDDYDFPRQIRVQYSDSSFDASSNQPIDWVDDTALTAAISIINNEVSDKIWFKVLQTDNQ